MARSYPGAVAIRWSDGASRMTTRLDQIVWVCDVQSSIVALGGEDAPPPPDYRPIAQADLQAAEKQTELGHEQLDWARNQFNTVWPYAQQYLTAQMDANQSEQARAKDQQQFYNETYKPVEKQFADEASSYASPERTEQRAGMAMADVSTQFDASRKAALSQLEGYGIDPSQTRFQALDLGSRVQQAAATAAAGNQSRLNTQATGLALEGEAIKTGRGYPGDVAQAYSTATGAGSAGLAGANSTINTGSNATGTPTDYYGLANKSRAGATSALDTGFGNAATATNINNQLAANTTKGIGSLIGGGLGAALLF